MGLTTEDFSKNPYAFLNISDGAEMELIVAAYRKLSTKYHPKTTAEPLATDKMQEINWAYAILSDPAKKEEWQRGHEYHLEYSGGSTSEDPESPPTPDLDPELSQDHLDELIRRGGELNFARMILPGLNFKGANLRRAIFEGADITQSYF